MGMIMVKCPQTGRVIPTGISPTVRLSCGALCSMAILIARSVAPITTGSLARPGSRSRSCGPGRYSRGCADA
jgi:hypothetical protein